MQPTRAHATRHPSKGSPWTSPNGGLWGTVYIVGALIVSYAMTWVCKRGRERALAAKSAATTAAGTE